MNSANKNFIKIGKHEIGSNRSIFIIAEAGVNHNGDIKIARKLIDAAAKAGANAIKFQTFNPSTLVTKFASRAEYQVVNIDKKESQYEMLERLKLKREDHRELKLYSQRKGLMFISTPFSTDDADFLFKLGVPAFKIGSGDINNLPYLRHIARKKLPIILSTGMSTLEEIRRSVLAIKKTGNNKIIILHCITSYPTPIADANLRAIVTLREKLNLLTGYSDHTSGIEASIAAAALGAVVIEKHLTLDRSLSGPDHKASLEPDELKLMVSSIRNIEKAIGSGEKKPTNSEKLIAEVARKSLVATSDIKKGEKFSSKNLGIKRPGTGLEPRFYDRVLGKLANADIYADELIKKEHYEKD